MARGGKRTGTPGNAYANRRDMRQPVRVQTGLAYGQHQALENAQEAIPLPNQGSTAPVPAAAAPQSPPAAAVPGQVDFARGTERPMEPVTTGLPSGPGPGPEVLGMAAPQNDVVGQVLNQLYSLNPNNDVLKLLDLHNQGY